MKIYQKTLLIILVVVVAGGALTVWAQEQGNYVPLAELPGTTEGGKATFESYVPGVVRLMIGLAALAAVFMIVLGGFTYMSTDAIGKKDSGRHMITRALWGLALALAAWLILNTINPNILNFKLELGSVSAPTGPSLGTFGGPEENAIRDRLINEAGISVNKDPCSSPTQTNCTNVAGLPESSIDSLIQFQQECDCGIIITGGTEAGHGTHMVGAPVLDLGKNSSLDSYIIENGGEPEDTAIGPLYKIGNSEYVNEGDHWHVCINSSCNIMGR